MWRRKRDGHFHLAVELLGHARVGMVDERLLLLLEHRLRDGARIQEPLHLHDTRGGIIHDGYLSKR